MELDGEPNATVLTVINANMATLRTIGKKSHLGLLFPVHKNMTLVGLVGGDRLCGQSFSLQIQRSRVRFPALPDFPRRRVSGTGSTQPREDN
jgi:hypothetical protein